MIIPYPRYAAPAYWYTWKKDGTGDAPYGQCEVVLYCPRLWQCILARYTAGVVGPPGISWLAVRSSDDSFFEEHVDNAMILQWMYFAQDTEHHENISRTLAAEPTRRIII